MKYPIGCRIRFRKTLDASPNEDHPAIVYARIGEKGEITGYDAREGYMVKADAWPHSFGDAPDEFEALAKA